jgi:23S rRNA (uracil1939-C5)-methyltransferase
MLSEVNDCDLLIVDPPRSGMDDKMIRAIECSKIPEILYISCSHMSFAKNLKDLKHYQLEELSAVDMFSNTPLVEIVAKLVRKHKSLLV